MSSHNGVIVRGGRLTRATCLCQPVNTFNGPVFYVVGVGGCPLHAQKAFLSNLRFHIERLRLESPEVSELSELEEVYVTFCTQYAPQELDLLERK